MKQTTHSSEIKWNAKTYHELAIAQYAAASNLINLLQLNRHSKVLDVGCGDGKVSAKLSAIVTEGSVIAIDKSVDMIAFAKENFPQSIYPNLHFFVQDAEKIHKKFAFNVIFSSFALQWIPNKSTFFKNAYRALKNSGRLALIAPLRVSPELESATNKTISSPKWANYFHNFCPPWHFVNSETLKHLIHENGFYIDHTLTTVQSVEFCSVKDLKEYILLWYPYLEPLDELNQEVFFSEVIQEYLALLPENPDGSVIMNIPRIDIIASKISL